MSDIVSVFPSSRYISISARTQMSSAQEKKHGIGLIGEPVVVVNAHQSINASQYGELLCLVEDN
jgi:hypothetical protein